MHDRARTRMRMHDSSRKRSTAHAQPRFSDDDVIVRSSASSWEIHGSLNHWNGQRMSLQQGVSHTSLEWTDGNDWAGSFPYFGKVYHHHLCLRDLLQKGQTDVPPAGNFPYFNEMD